jgi:hypothetical protein
MVQSPPLRCPKHGTALYFEFAEMWWRCLRPDCHFKVTTAEIIDDVLSWQPKSAEAAEESAPCLKTTVTVVLSEGTTPAAPPTPQPAV